MLSGFGFDDIIIWCFFLAKKKRNLEFWKKYVCGALKRKNGTWEMLSGFGFGGDLWCFLTNKCKSEIKKEYICGTRKRKNETWKMLSGPSYSSAQIQIKGKETSPNLIYFAN